MVQPPDPHRLKLPVAPLVAGAVGLLTAGLFALIPTDLLEAMVVDSGIASVLSAAEPPLGFTARLALVLLCGGGVALVAWLAVFLALGKRTLAVRRPGKTVARAPVLRRADAHPDAPARRPIFANTDLGTPFHEVRAAPVHVEAAPVIEPPAERPLPDDLDQPIAAFDPGAMPAAAVVESPPPAPLVRQQTFDAGERFETFALTPMVRAAPPKPDSSETIQALLDRLERVAGRRAPQPMPEPVLAPEPPRETIENTLTALRRMAGGR